MTSFAVVLTVAATGLTLLSPAQAGVSMSPAVEGEQCQFLDGAVGRCEKMSSCMISKGVVRRNGDLVLCKNRNSLDLVACCRRPYLVAEEMCSVWAKYWLMGTPEMNEICTSSKPLIHGGEEAGLGEFPNMAALGEPTSDGHTKWFCGGSLITPAFVLTAAHCVYVLPKFNPNIVVSLGGHDLNNRVGGRRPRLDRGLPNGLQSAVEPGELDPEAPMEQMIKVAEVWIYPEYQHKYHDIALLHLQRPAVLTNRVLPACLPTRVPHIYSSDSTFAVAGWGNYIFGTPLDSDPLSGGSRKLQKVNIGFVGSTQCGYDYLNITNFGYPPLGITTDMICAGAPNKDSCQGDSGGPLMERAELPTDNGGFCLPQMVTGIVSFGPRACDSLGIYTRVATYIDWVTGIVAPGLLPAGAK